MKDLLDAIRDLRILVVGEAIRDVYTFVQPLGLSQKDTIVTWRQGREESYEGGAVACANHLRDFCPNVGLMTQEIAVVKRRFVLEPWVTKLFAVESLAIASDDRMLFRERLKDLRHYDVVIVADYGHGLLDDDAIGRICDESHFLAVMAQTNSSNHGFNIATARYPRADYLCLDELEARLAMHDRDGPLELLASKLRQRLDAAMVAITLGHRGSLITDAMGQAFEPIASHRVVDRMGAGDAFLSLTAPCVALGATPAQVGLIGNAAGALAVQTIGNATPITRAKLEALLP